MRYAIILAGGKGERFWPLSRRLEPKQFLRVCSNKSMLEETIYRLSPLIKKENIYLAAGRIHGEKIKSRIKNFNIPLKNILLEPYSRSTLAPIAILSDKIQRQDPAAIIAVLPCDHLVQDKARFLKLLNKGMNIANSGFIVTLGIPPTRPESGYGYIRVESKIKNPCLTGRQAKSKIYKVDKFIEKPDLAKAKKLIRDKRYYWNSGIFIFRPDAILSEIKRFTPAAYAAAIKINSKKDLNKLWRKFPPLSVDYAVMEKTKRMALLPADYGWIDLGSWKAIEEASRKDKDGNVFKGNCVNIASRNSIVWSDNRLVAAVGLDNIIIVNTKDALLVCHKDRAQDVKKVVQTLYSK